MKTYTLDTTPPLVSERSYYGTLYNDAGLGFADVFSDSGDVVLAQYSPAILEALRAGIRLIFDISEALEDEGHARILQTETRAFHAQASAVLAALPLNIRLG
jgi:hypothetical protein